MTYINSYMKAEIYSFLTYEKYKKHSSNTHLNPLYQIWYVNAKISVAAVAWD